MLSLLNFFVIELCSNNGFMIIWLCAQIEPFHDTVVDAALGNSLLLLEADRPFRVWRSEGT